jgi:hypothetical protein
MITGRRSTDWASDPDKGVKDERRAEDRRSNDRRAPRRRMHPLFLCTLVAHLTPQAPTGPTRSGYVVAPVGRAGRHINLSA